VTTPQSNSGAFLQRWVINTLAVLVATYAINGITFGSWIDLLVATLILGILNSFVRPLLVVLSLPFLILTLGLFTFVINAVLLLLVSWFMGPKHFHVAGFGSALLGAVVISLISVVLNALTGTRNPRSDGRKQTSPPPPRQDKGGGPIIDV
jgi:putative membrane protein